MSPRFTLRGKTPEPMQRLSTRGQVTTHIKRSPGTFSPRGLFFVAFPALPPGTAAVYHALISVWMWDSQKIVHDH